MEGEVKDMSMRMTTAAATATASVRGKVVVHYASTN
jgi:hypothetical protein